ncbi:MAG: UvrD-helicase domain-containing protein [Deltaproteobacteria bacterium]|nr:UvrD-helicase domain-containing protein [Deltaproteobacteria bacterium]
MNSQSLVAKLNPPQQEAVLHTEGPLLVFAGAGSGKTRVLTHRIAYLIQEKGVSPWNIFAVTFTNKAAGEMKERIGHLLGSRADDVWISTFHSSGVKILRRHAEKIGLGPYFTIFDDSDQMTLIKEALETLNINPKIYSPRSVQAKINNAKNELISPENYSKKYNDFFDEKVAQVYSWYEEKLRKNNSVDFGDLLLLPVRLFEQHPEILKLYQDRFRYLLVDEYQDTNHAQYRLIKLLAQAHHNLCVVGDDDQSIYRWRGADIKNILDFELDFKDATVIKLEQNYRSTQTILKAAHAVVNQIEGRRPKQLWTENDEGEKITLFTSKSEKGEASFVVQKIKETSERENISLNQFALFYRTNAQSRVFEDELRKHNLPYIIVGGTRFYDRLEIKDMLAYLYIISNPQDSLHLKRIINVPGRGIGKTSIEKLESLASARGLNLFDALSFPQEAGIAGKTAQEVLKFLELLKTLRTSLEDQNLSSRSATPERDPVGLPLASTGSLASLEMTNNKKLSEWVKSLMEATGYIAELKAEKTIEAESRLENLQELLSVVADFEISNPQGTLSHFLEQITLASDLDKMEDGKGVLPLMTLHLAKGLEFNYVFLVGLEEGLFPHTRSFESPEEMNEERRLMYVGMTRAKKELFMSHAQTRLLYGREQWNLPSRFLEDVPKNLLHLQEEQATSSRSGMGNHTVDNSSSASATNSDNPYQVGRKVKHPIFGFGTIKVFEGNVSDAKLTVLFQNGELKRLLVKYANLQLM